MSESEQLTQTDDNFCEELYQDYMNSWDKNESYSLEDCKKEWGLINISPSCWWEQIYNQYWHNNTIILIYISRYG